MFLCDITKELFKFIGGDTEYLYIVDIRELDQIVYSEIFHFNLVTITRGDLEFNIENKTSDKKLQIVVYFNRWKRGIILVARTLNDIGYTNVLSLKGGIK